MGKNRESSTLLGFQEQFTTEEVCAEHLFRLRWPNGFICSSCGSTRHSVHSTPLGMPQPELSLPGIVDSRDYPAPYTYPIAKVVLGDVPHGSIKERNQRDGPQTLALDVLSDRLDDDAQALKDDGRSQCKVPILQNIALLGP